MNYDLRTELGAVTVLICASAALTYAEPVAAEQKNKDEGITSKSKQALVVMRVPTFSFNYAMSLSRDGKTGFLSRVYLMQVRSDTGYQYVSRTLKPGTYVMTALYQQSGWQSCFADKTPKFTVEAGKVYYFGTLDVERPLANLQQDAVDRDRTQLPLGGLSTQWNPKDSLVWTIASDTEVEDLKTFLAKEMPRTTASPLTLDVTYSSLTISGSERAMQVCG